VKRRAKVIWAAVVLYLVIVGVVIGALVWAASYRRGSGDVITEARPVGGFDRVAVSGMGTLVIAQGNEDSLTVEAEDNVLPEIETLVDGGASTSLSLAPPRAQSRGGKLEIRFRRWWPRGIRPTKPIRYHLTARNISAISTSGSVGVEGTELRGDELSVATSGSSQVDLAVAVKSLHSIISGSGTFRLRGVTESQSAEISGSGEYLARDLRSRRCTLRVSGSGAAQVAAAEVLDVAISGSGDVSYWGNPVVTKAISGSGDVHRGEA
jgi:hypothetical protein